ncbi:MAG: sensor histidine kinase, partial [Chitinophagaceae bacterium]
GSTFFADIFSNTISLGGRNLVTGFFTDVTQRHENQEALLSSNAELKKINTELDNFVYSVSHDLRSPLLAIQGLIQLINSPASSDAENTRNYLSMVNASINRMDDTIKEILEYSRNARLAIQKEEIDFRKLVEGIFDDVKHIYPNSIDLELIIDCEYPFYSDPFRITTLFKNIISNAVKYQRRGPEQSFVKIHICADPEKVKLRFEDNGEGIGPEHLDKIFDMFYRASNSSVGTGLGLYICREIVNNLGGQISAASIPGKGSVFTVVLDNLNH